MIDRETFGLLEDRTRRNIIQILREEELNVKELSGRLGQTPQNFYHHIKKLLDSGLIIEVQEKRSGHLIESYYTSSADTFFYYEDKMPSNDTHIFIEILNGLNEFGANLQVSNESAETLSNLSRRRSKFLGFPNPNEDVCGLCGYSGYFMKFGPMNPTLLGTVLYYRQVLDTTDEEFEESLNIVRELRSYLRSIKDKSRST
jgi:DNA-binding transcriptional ArsR family regulator